MGKRHAIGAALAAALLAGAAPASAQDLLQIGANRWIADGGDLPAPKEEFAYSDADAFDVQLYASLQSLADVRVTLPTPRQTLPARLSLWKDKIESTRDRKKSEGGTLGEVATCDTSKASGFGGILGSIITDVAGDVIDMFRRKSKQWVLFKPVRRFDAIVEIDSSDNLIRAMRFVRRDDFTRVQSFYRKCDA